jgi:hypothetical protein
VVSRQRPERKEVDVDVDIEDQLAYELECREYQANGQYFATDPGHDVRPYILPFGREYGRWNPRDVANAAFGQNWLKDMVALVCLREDQPRTRPSRVIFSHNPGELSERDKIGQRFTARHDQTNALLGEYRIVGIVRYSSEDGSVEKIVGDVPNVKLTQNTYK